MKAFYAKVAGRLRTFDFDLKRLALQALQVKIVVGKSGAQFQGAIPTNLGTTEQTSGCVFNRVSRAERNCTGRVEQNYATERRGVRVKVLWYVRA